MYGPQLLQLWRSEKKEFLMVLRLLKKANDSLEEAKLNYEAELDKAKSESADIVEKANQRASQIISEAKTKAEAEAEKIIASANKNLEAEINKTKEALRKDVSEIIVSTTEKILGDEISQEKHEKIISEAAQKI
jgi:F-type H+-transporting ATPase subunit b